VQPSVWVMPSPKTGISYFPNAARQVGASLNGDGIYSVIAHKVKIN
jgi:hypothetical protein